MTFFLVDIGYHTIMDVAAATLVASFQKKKHFGKELQILFDLLTSSACLVFFVFFYFYVCCHRAHVRPRHKIGMC